MKKSASLLFVLLFTVMNSTAQGNKIKCNDYFGQTPPGKISVIFAPGIISTNQWEAAGTFSPDGKYLFFHRTVDGNGDIYWVNTDIIWELKQKR